MPQLRYQDVYPSVPAINSGDLARRSAADLLTLEYFEAEPAKMPTEVFEQHHILLNLNEVPHRVENWRNGRHRDFTFCQGEVIVTPAGISSGWRWHAKSKVIVVTLDPKELERFAKHELGTVLTDQQLVDEPQFLDKDLVLTGKTLCESLQAEFGSAVMFEGLARVFLVKLLERYAHQDATVSTFSESFTPQHFQRVLDFVADNFGNSITVEETGMGGQAAGRSPEEGADTAIWLATLPADGPTGGFFRDRRQIGW